MSQVKETWEKLAAAAAQDDQASKAFEALDAVEKSLKDVDYRDDDDGGFRLPYSSRPKCSNGRWK